MISFIIRVGMRKLWLILIAVLSFALPLQAGWTRAGLYGADVRALVVDPKNPDVLYLGTSQGEVYASTDAGTSWTNPRLSTPFPGYVVDNLVIDGKGRLWAAAWGLWGGGVIAMSGDGGVSWSRRDAGLEKFSVRAIAVDPRDESRLVVGGLDGVHISEDSGNTWRKISDQINVESLAIDPRNADTIFVGTWRQAWRTDDGGKTWKHIEKGMVLDTDVFAIQINPKNPDSVWVSTCGWVYNSKDRGDTWVRYRDGFNNRRIHDVKVDPHDDKIVYAASVAGLYRTEDEGKAWKLVSDENLVINAIVLHPERPERIILGTEGDGIYVSDDRGATFRRSNRGLYNVKVAGVASDPVKKNRLYAAVYFGGAASGIYESHDGGEQWRKLSETKLPEMLSFIVRDVSPKFVAGTERGIYWSEDGREWTPSEPATLPIRVDKIVPYNETRLFGATSEGVLTSKDGGKKWYRLADLNEKTIDIAIGRIGGKRALYAMTSSGLAVFDGTQWRRIEGAPTRGKQIAVRTEGESELVVIGSLQGIRAGKIDAEGRWEEETTPAGPFVDVHAAHGKDKGMLFIAARDRRDLLVSSTIKPQWKTLNAPLDPLSIVDVAADSHDNDTLYFGTSGQGVFIYRDVLPPRSSSPNTHTAPAGSK